MRQAYDYWQNQPDNYRPPRKNGNRCCEQRRRDVKFTGWRPETRRAKHLRQEPWAPCEPAIRFPTHVFPSEAVDHTEPERAACGLGHARRRTQRPTSAIAASGGRGCLPLLDGRTRQRPVIHRTHPYSGDCRGIRRLQGIPSTP